MTQPATAANNGLSRWEMFMMMMKMCGECCYVTCPPVPELVTRKLAFHPPPKGLTYKILLKDGTEVKSAKELLGKQFLVELTDFIRKVNPSEQQEIKEIVEAFVTTNIYQNHLIGVRIQPSVSSRSTSQHCQFDHPTVDQVVLFSQPNSSDLGHLLHPSTRVFQRMADSLGVDIYAYDYSGYGFSTGSPSEKNIYADIRAMYNYIRQTRPNVRVVLVGFSIGTTATIHLAAEAPPQLAGVVLLAAFWSGLSLLRNQADPSKEVADFLDRFRNIDRIGKIDVPVLLIHGANDDLVPIQHSQEMHKILKKPVTPLYVYGANHSTILTIPITNQRIYRFLLSETDIGPILMNTSK